MSSASIELETKLIERTVSKRNEIIARAKERVDKILEAAEGERRRIKAESDKQVMNILGSELRAIRDRIVGKADLDGRKMLMQAREEVLSFLFNEAKSRLGAVADGRDKSVDYRAVMNRFLVEAVSSMGGEEFIVSANERDREFLKGNLNAVKELVRGKMGNVNVSLDDEAINVIGGVMVRNKEGTKINHNTLEARLMKARGRMEAKVAETLGVI